MKKSSVALNLAVSGFDWTLLVVLLSVLPGTRGNYEYFCS